MISFIIVWSQIFKLPLSLSKTDTSLVGYIKTTVARFYFFSLFVFVYLTLPSSIVTVCGFSTPTNTLRCGRLGSFAVYGRKLVLTRAPCGNSGVIAPLQQQGRRHRSPAVYLTLVGRTAPILSENTPPLQKPATNTLNSVGVFFVLCFGTKNMW